VNRYKFLANENFPRSSLLVLRAAGWDISSIAEDCPGMADRMVLEQAYRESRIIVTFDADYGELVFHRNVQAPPSIIYLRFIPKSGDEAAKVILDLVAQHGEYLNGFFFTVDRTLVRKRPVTPVL